MCLTYKNKIIRKITKINNKINQNNKNNNNNRIKLQVKL